MTSSVLELEQQNDMINDLLQGFKKQSQSNHIYSRKHHAHIELSNFALFCKMMLHDPTENYYG